MIQSDQDNEHQSPEEWYAFLLDTLIEQAKYLNHLNIALANIQLDLTKTINIMKQNQKNWRFLLSQLKPLQEDVDGIHSFTSTNLAPRLLELEKISSKKKSKWD